MKIELRDSSTKCNVINGYIKTQNQAFILCFLFNIGRPKAQASVSWPPDTAFFNLCFGHWTDSMEICSPTGEDLVMIMLIMYYSW